MSELVIAFFDLLEAEGRALQRGALRTGLGLALLLVAGLLALTGFGFLIWALYGWLAGRFTQPEAASLTGGAALVVTGILLWLAIRLGR